MPKPLVAAVLDRKGRRRYRFLEFLPGTAVWLTFAVAVAVSLAEPFWAVLFIIAFDLYWFFRVLTFVIYLTISWRRHRGALDVDWGAALRATPGHERIRHLVFLPTYKEGLDVLRATFASLAAAEVDPKTMIVVLAGEARSGRDEFMARAEAIRAEFGDRFLKLIVTVHPADIEGEVAGKGSNLHYAGPIAREAVDALGIAHDDVIVSTFDVDTVAHPRYFAHLAKTYLDTPDRTRASYQPVVLYSNNIWDAPAVIRIAAFGTTFWLMSELARPERLFTFSSHSMPLRALVEVGYWQRDVVSEDSRIFLQCLIHYDGDYRVVPLYVPVSMDAVMAPTWIGSLVNLYKQQRRWAWGVEHFPYLVTNFFSNGMTMPLKRRLGTLWNLCEGMYTWATAPVLMFLLGWLPLLVARLSDRREIVFQNAPHALEVIMTFAMLGVLASAALSLPLLPTRPRHRGPGRFVAMLLQWALLPLTFILFGAVPAIEAQTRLLLGRRLGFWVTPKERGTRSTVDG